MALFARRRTAVRIRRGMVPTVGREAQHAVGGVAPAAAARPLASRPRAAQPAAQLRGRCALPTRAHGLQAPTALCCAPLAVSHGAAPRRVAAAGAAARLHAASGVHVATDWCWRVGLEPPQLYGSSAPAARCEPAARCRPPLAPPAPGARVRSRTQSQSGAHTRYRPGGARITLACPRRRHAGRRRGRRAPAGAGGRHRQSGAPGGGGGGADGRRARCRRRRRSLVFAH